MYYQRTMLYRVLDSFLRHKWLFIISVAIIVGLLVIYVVTRPAKFACAYTVIVSPKQTQNPLSQDDTSEPAYDILVHTVNQLQALILTKKFIQSALTTPDGKPLFMHVPVDINNLDQLNKLQKSVVVTSDNVDAFTVQFTWPNADDALAVLNGIVYAYIKQDADQKTAFLSTNVAFLSNEVSAYKAQLSSAEATLANWKKAHPAGDPTNMAGSQQDLENLKERRDELRVQIQSAQERIAALQQQLVETPKKIVAVERLTEGPESPLQTRLDELQAELQDDTIVKGMTQDHPVVIALKTQIGRLQQAIAAQKHATSSIDTRDLQPNPVYEGLQNQLLQTQIDLKSLNTQLADADNRANAASAVVANDPDYERQLANLTRNYRIYDQEYDTLLDRLQQARINEQINRRQVSDQYTVLLTEEPTSVTKGKSAVMLFGGGFILAILVGVSLVFASEWLDRSLRDPIDAQAALGVPVLALLPEMGGPTASMRLLNASDGSKNSARRKALMDPMIDGKQDPANRRD